MRRMSKMIATAHIVPSVSAAVLLGVRYVEAIEFRACVNPNDVIACRENCGVVGNAEFYLQPNRTVAVKVVPVSPKMQPTIHSLENCVIIDQTNWSCSQDQNGWSELQVLLIAEKMPCVVLTGWAELIGRALVDGRYLHSDRRLPIARLIG